MADAIALYIVARADHLQVWAVQKSTRGKLSQEQT